MLRWSRLKKEIDAALAREGKDDCDVHSVELYDAATDAELYINTIYKHGLCVSVTEED